MKMSPQDWRSLRLPLIVLAVVAVVIAGLVYFTYQQQEKTAQLLREQEQRLNEARQRFQSSGQEKETIVQYLPVYQRLISEGFIGEEKRIEWVDMLRTIHQENKLFGINYSIGMQDNYKPAFSMNPGRFTLHRSTMALELAMLHEGDLLLLMETLRDRRVTPFILRECEITKRPGATFDKFTPNMQANCELDWLTIREPQAVLGVVP